MKNIKKISILCIMLCLGMVKVWADQMPQQSRVALFKDMFQEMVVKKNADLIPSYYSKDFVLYSNGQKESYSEFFSAHKKYYKTPIQYKVEFDNDATIENGDKLAMRVFITTKMPGKAEQKIEVILIAQYKDNKIFRIWEVTDPDWSKMKEFKK